MRRWMKRHWKLTVLIIVAIVGGCSFGMLEYTHDPNFCKSCHVMGPYYDAWEMSSHKGISCVKCHYPPGIRSEIEGKKDALNQLVAYATGRIGTKFHAEIPDISCLRSGCHDSRVDSGVEDYGRGIKFDHSHHYGKEVRDIELRCTSCHSQIVQGSHIAVTISTCFICHFRNRFEQEASTDRDFCLMCHDYPSGMVNAGGRSYNHADYVENEGVLCWFCHSDVVQGNGEVEDRACLQCHDNPDQLDRITEVEEVHRNHVTDHKVECFNCHADIKHRIPEYPAAGAPTRCDTCHSGTHAGPAQLYAGTGGRSVPDSPSAMYLTQLDCGGCHRELVTPNALPGIRGTTTIVTAEACADCHGELGRQVLEFWQDSLETQLAETKAVIALAQQAAQQAAGVPPELKRKLEDAVYNHALVEYGHGEHNITYAIDLLDQATSDAKAVVEGLLMASP